MSYYTLSVSPLRALLVASLLLIVVSTACAADHVIVVLGDSLTRLRREGFDYRVVNAGVSGDTSAGGLRRVDWALKTHPEIVVVALGANDGLRGQPVAALRDNLTRIIERARAAGARVLLAGMRVPPNYGADYARAFAGAYPAVARTTGAALAPFLLDGVAGDARLNQADGIHPTAEGQRVIAERLWPHLKALLSK